MICLITAAPQDLADSTPATAYSRSLLDEIPTGFPLLVDTKSGVIEEALHFCVDLYFHWGRAGSVKTLLTYSEHLLHWLRSLEVSGYALADATPRLIRAYRRALVSSTGLRGTTAPATVEARIGAIVRFYQWLDEARPKTLPPELSRYLAQTGATSRKREVSRTRDPLRQPLHKQLPREISAPTESLLLGCAAPDLRLAIEWGLRTGARRKEILSITISALKEAILTCNGQIGDISVRTKGKDARRLYVPLNLLESSLSFAAIERELITPPLTEYRDFLFINSRGHRMSGPALTTRFGRLTKKIDAPARFHDLRHTFAIRTLRLLVAEAEKGRKINPLKAVQFLLGHRSVESTEVYTRALEVNLERLFKEAPYLFGATELDEQQ